MFTVYLLFKTHTHTHTEKEQTNGPSVVFAQQNKDKNYTSLGPEERGTERERELSGIVRKIARE